MAELAKKINIKKNDTIQTAKIYTTVAETGSTVTMPVKVDGVQGYVGLVDTNNALATSLRVKKAGVTYAVPRTGTPPYARIVLTSSGTFTVPEGVVKLRIVTIGGGGGGGVHGLHRDYSVPFYTYYHTAVGSNGGNTSFNGAFVATGGTGGGLNGTPETSYDSESAQNTYYIRNPTLVAGKTGGPNAGYNGTTGGDNAVIKGGAGLPFDADPNTTKTLYGAGGGAGAPSNSKSYWDYMGSGGSGGWNYGDLMVKPGQVITYIVGTGGNGVKMNMESNSYANAGANGAIQVEYGKGVQ